MLELRFHGRGGQGAVTSAELLALAAIAQGKFAQAFPSFGPERRGAPVVAYARIAEKQIRNRTAVTTPDAVLVLDPSLLSIVNTSEGKRRKFYILWNSADTLHVQQNETAGTGFDQASETEQTDCSDITLGSAFPKYDYNTGSVQVGNTYEIGTGTDESGFGDFWSYMMVAEGAVDMACEPDLELYDKAALDIIDREAGGTFTDLDGVDGPFGPGAIASNGLLHGELVDRLRLVDLDDEETTGIIIPAPGPHS